MSSRNRRRTNRRGRISVADVAVMVVIATIVLFFLLMALPRGREHARSAACTRNMGRIGVALAVFDQIQGKLPVVGVPPGLDDPGAVAPPAPLRTIIDVLKLPDFSALSDPSNPPQPQPDRVPGERIMPDFLCPSDRGTTAGVHPAPTSYRACTGDVHSGRNGVFALGRELSLARVQEIDGVSFKAAFAERLVGDGQPRPSVENYLVVPRLPSDARPDPAAARGDAGGRWTVADYRYTLYNHELAPGASPSLIAADGKSALMGASSSHERGVNVLFCDGRVDVVRPTVDQTLWRRLGRVELEQHD